MNAMTELWKVPENDYCLENQGTHPLKTQFYGRYVL